MKSFGGIIFMVFFLAACKNDGNLETNEIENNLDTTKKETTIKNSINVELNYPKKDSLFNYSVEIPLQEDYSVEVKTKLIYDSTFLFDKYYIGGNQAILNQKLIFKRGDSILRENSLSFTETNTHKINGRLMKLPKYVLTSIFLDSSYVGNLKFFSTYSFGLSNGTKEISSYYSIRGSLIVQTDCNKIICDTIGDASFLRGNKNYFESKKLREIIIFPPQSAGKSDL